MACMCWALQTVQARRSTIFLVVFACRMWAANSQPHQQPGMGSTRCRCCSQVPQQPALPLSCLHSSLLLCCHSSKRYSLLLAAAG